VQEAFPVLGRENEIINLGQRLSHSQPPAPFLFACLLENKNLNWGEFGDDQRLPPPIREIDKCDLTSGCWDGIKTPEIFISKKSN
jgi:hypothetical protein